MSGIPFRLASRQASLIIVQVEVNDLESPLPFVLDTGASNTCLGADLAARLGLAAGREQEAAGAGGSFQVRLVRLKRLALGKWEKRGLQVALLDLGLLREKAGTHIEGILGYNFFRDALLSIDYANRRLRLRKAVKRRPASRRRAQRSAGSSA